jgi:4-hydroxybenzoate polyprenyltransferase
VLLQLNQSCIVLGLCAMPLVVAYPLMKRVTHFPQLVLGLTFNWGALIGYMAVTDSVAATLQCAAPLYLAGVCW